MWRVMRLLIMQFGFGILICDLGVVDSIEKPIMMYCDNTVIVSFSNKLKGTPRSRYIDVKYFLVKEKVEEGLIMVVHTPTYSMVADPLTRPYR